MKRIDRYDLSKASELKRLFNDFRKGPSQTFEEFVEELYKEIPTKKRYELLKCDEDLKNMAKEHQEFCNKFNGVCREECPYGSCELHSCFMNFLLEEIECE